MGNWGGIRTFNAKLKVTKKSQKKSNDYVKAHRLRKAENEKDANNLLKYLRKGKSEDSSQRPSSESNVPEVKSDDELIQNEGLVEVDEVIEFSKSNGSVKRKIDDIGGGYVKGDETEHEDKNDEVGDEKLLKRSHQLALQNYEFSGQALPYFQNGCLAMGKDKKAKEYFTCAIDSIEVLLETLLLSSMGGKLIERNCPIIKAVTDILTWRCENQFQWSHPLREQYWDLLCTSFPDSFTPKGTIRATVEETLNYINEADKLTVQSEASCRECKTIIGIYKYSLDQVVFLCQSKKLKSMEEYTLTEILESSIFSTMADALRLKVKCTLCPGSRGCGVLSEDNMAAATVNLPNVLLLNLSLIHI